MEESASTPALQTVANRPDRSHRRLQADLHRDYEAAYGRPPQTRQLELLTDAASWLLRALAYQGEEWIVRSWPQIARGMGFPELPTVREISNRWTRQMYRTFGYLREMGWVEGWEAVLEAKGNSSGIVLRAGPKALARPPELRSALMRGGSSVGRAQASQA